MMCNHHRRAGCFECSRSDGEVEAARVRERLAVLERVGPLLNAAIMQAKEGEIAALTVLAVRISKAILERGAK